MTVWWNFGDYGKSDDELEDNDSILGGGSYYDYYSKSLSRRRYNSSLGWSRSKLTDTASYYSSGWKGSSINFGDKDSKSGLTLLSKAYKAVRDMVVILDFPFEVIIKFTNSEFSSYLRRTKKTRTITVQSNAIDYSDYSDDEKINILCGMGTHEASHLKYTEYRTYISYMKKSSVSREQKFFANLLEDTRVEDKLLSERPGYLDFIEDSIKFRYRIFSERVKKYSSEADIYKFLTNVVKFIRYPDKIDSEIVKKFESQFKEIKSILSKGYQFTKDSCILGTMIYDYIDSFLTELKYPSSTLSKFIKDICPDDSFEVKYGQDSSGDETLFNSEVSKIFEDSSGLISKLYSEIISGDKELGDGDKTFFEKPTGTFEKYQEVKKNISKYIPVIRKSIMGTDKNYEFTIHGCREGLLDTDKLAEAYQGIPQVYIKKGKVETNKTTVCVLIDQSGSMSGPKIRLAKEAAILLNESLKDLPGVNLYIYGHSADENIMGDTIITVYREGNKYKPNYALSATSARANNRDGTAILEVAKRVRKSTSDKCIMFVLSDGSPAAHYYNGLAAIEDVKTKVGLVEKMGFNVIQVSIDYVHYAKEMFKNVISLEYNLSNFPKRLSQIIKKAIVDSKETTVS
jgi:hypothetical protein